MFKGFNIFFVSILFLISTNSAHAAKCKPGYHLEGGVCISNTRPCDVENGVGFETYANGKWGACKVVSCNYGYTKVKNACVPKCGEFEHLENNVCVSNARSCEIANGVGRETYANNTWGPCTLVSCNTGYQQQNNTCVQIQTQEEKVTVYDDTVNPLFNDWSWATTSNVNYTSDKFAGNSSYQADLVGGTALNFFINENIGEKYEAIEFAVKAISSDTQKLNLVLVDGQNAKLSKAVANTKQWTVVRVNFADMGYNYEIGNISNFWLGNGCRWDNGECQSNTPTEFLFDEIKLIKRKNPIVKECSIANGKGKQWILANGEWSTCQVVSCNSGYLPQDNQCLPLGQVCPTGQHSENGVCFDNTRACTVDHGKGQQMWLNGAWGSCVAVSCDTGYHIEGAKCVLGDPPPVTKWVSGYYAGYERDMYPPEKVDFSAMTHFAMASVMPNADGTLNTTFFLGETEGPALAKQMSALAHQAGKKAILMIGGAGSIDGWRGATTSTNRSKLVNNIIKLVDEFGYDGVDIDWEPIQESSGDLQRIISVIQEIKVLKPGILVTLPGPWVGSNPWSAFSANEKAFWKNVSEMVEHVNVMTYGMAANWDGWPSWFGNALYGETTQTPSSVKSTMDRYIEAGVPKSKLGIGIAFSGACWTGPSRDWYQAGETPVLIGTASTLGVTGPRQTLRPDRYNPWRPGDRNSCASDHDLNYAFIKDNIIPNGVYHWDDAAKVPYVSNENPQEFGPSWAKCSCSFLSYENDQSVAEKAKYVWDNEIGGLIIWTINQGYYPSNSTNPLLDAVKKGFLPAK